MPIKPESLPLFQGVPAPLLAASSVVRSYRLGEFVFRQGEPTSGLWVILEGRTAIERTGPDSVIHTTGVWQPGDIVGIAGIWDGSGYPAAARTLDAHTRLLWVERDRFLRLYRTVPAFAEAVSRMLAERLRYSQELVSDTRGRPVAVQVAVILSTLMARQGADVALTHEDLAHMVGTTRETVSRVLSDFHHRGGWTAPTGTFGLWMPARWPSGLKRGRMPRASGAVGGLRCRRGAFRPDFGPASKGWPVGRLTESPAATG